MKRKVPVYRIGHFRNSLGTGEFYANHLAPHIREHGFIAHPHRHDFYLVMLFTQGSGTHSIDFKTYPVRPGALFFMRPGQLHVWHLSKDADGFLFFHDSIFFNQSLQNQILQASSWHRVFYGKAYHSTTKKEQQSLLPLFRELTAEFKNPGLLDHQKIQALLTLCYIEVLRIIPRQNIREHAGYLDTLRQFREQIDKHYKSHKTASDYALLLNLSDKHLNRICRTCLNKTTTELISERLIDEAKRLLLSTSWTISQISDELGYKDKSYFSRHFRKSVGMSPQTFQNNQQL